MSAKYLTWQVGWRWSMASIDIKSQDILVLSTPIGSLQNKIWMEMVKLVPKYVTALKVNTCTQ